jgi:glutamine amidotransferase
MQWLLEGSTEAPDQPGLGYFLGHCERFPEAGEKVPHVGWNQLDISDAPPSRLLSGINNGEHVYFTHSYHAPLNTFVRNDQGEIDWPLAAQTDYIEPFASAVEYNNVFGVQFHPEKSGETGLKILKNFLELA